MDVADRGDGEIRDPDEVRDYLLQGLWLQAAGDPTPDRVRPALEWVLEIVSNGQPTPPVGFVADLGALAAGHDHARRTARPVPGWPAEAARAYEDGVLGKVAADWTFERAADALRRYHGRDRARGLAYVVRQVRERGRLGGVEFSPAVLRGLLPLPPDELLARGYESLSVRGPHPRLVPQYAALARAFRGMADVLGPEDVVALEHGTALADLGQYVAHRQTLQTAAGFEAGLPARPVRPLAGRRDVPTRVPDEDQYPVGGYASIATSGSVESLLHSQLAYMEPPEPPSPGSAAGAHSPDLFDLKFVRGELFYYSRDDNRFLRRRRAFVFALFPDLAAARTKDPDLPVQRIVAALAVVLTLVRRLTDWLSTDALRFEVVLVRPDPPTGGDGPPDPPPQPLAAEADLLRLLLREPIARGVAVLSTADGARGVERRCADLARHSQVHCLAVATAPVAVTRADVVVTQLVVDGPAPTVIDGHGTEAVLDADDAPDRWRAAVTRVLELWV